MPYSVVSFCEVLELLRFLEQVVLLLHGLRLWVMVAGAGF
jgi:hypothetical protein